MHFDEKDFKNHGGQKRLHHGALPLNFPKKDAILLDHSYFSTTALDLVRIYFNIDIIVGVNNDASSKPRM